MPPGPAALRGAFVTLARCLSQREKLEPGALHLCRGLPASCARAIVQKHFAVTQRRSQNLPLTIHLCGFALRPSKPEYVRLSPSSPPLQAFGLLLSQEGAFWAQRRNPAVAPQGAVRYNHLPRSHSRDGAAQQENKPQASALPRVLRSERRHSMATMQRLSSFWGPFVIPKSHSWSPLPGIVRGSLGRRQQNARMFKD